MRNSARLRNMYSHSGYVTVPTGTSYTSFIGSTPNVSEAARRNVTGVGGVLKELYLRTNAASGGGGSIVVTVRKNGINTTLAVTIAAGSGAGTFSTIVGKIPVTAGDILTYGIVNSSGGTIPLQSWIYLYS